MEFREHVLVPINRVKYKLWNTKVLDRSIYGKQKAKNINSGAYGDIQYRQKCYL